jgi:hypothetical protein
MRSGGVGLSPMRIIQLDLFGSGLILKKRNNDIYESRPELMHALQATFVLVAVLGMLSHVRGDVASYVDVNACDGTLGLVSAVDNAVLYDQVYNWMHQKKISNWTYKSVQAAASLRAHFALPENETLACAEVSYRADLQLPDVFQTFLHHLGLDLNLPISVHKTVCGSGEVLVEQAEVEVAVVNTVSINAMHDLTEGGLRTATEVRIDIPWYAQMLSRLIKAHIGQSVAEKNRAVRDSLCTAVAKPALLERNSSFLTPPRHAHLRRSRRMPEGEGTAPRLWRLRLEHGNACNESNGCNESKAGNGSRLMHTVATQ